MHRIKLRIHPRQALIASAIGVVACVSLTPPPRGGGNVPVVRGVYRSGAEQIVRIVMPNVDSADIGATGEWGIFTGDQSSPVARYAANQTVRFAVVRDCTGGNCVSAMALSPRVQIGTGREPLIARPLRDDSFITWAGKPYRGDLMVSATDSGIMGVNRLPMNSYLRGVVPLEIGNRTAAEMAAVEAQAVAARTYAYKHLNAARAFDMYSTVQDQVYGGASAEKPQSDAAINSTADVIVLYNGRPITTPYHSTCGGTTAGVSEVWYDQPDEPYLRPVSDKIPGSDHFYCDPSPRFSWTQNYDAAGLRAVMEKYLSAYTNAPKSGLGAITDIRETGRTRSGRVEALQVRTASGTYTLRGNDIRFVLRDPKGAILNSTFFSFDQDKSGGEVSALTINGRGYGHGIGMCQWGAIGRARAGQDYRTILETYYPGTTIGRIAG